MAKDVTRTATIVVLGVFREGHEPYFEEYSARVRAYLNKHAGTVVRRQRIAKRLYGQGAADLFMVIDFPTREVAERIFFEPEYLSIVPLRDRIFADFRMYLAESGEL